MAEFFYAIWTTLLSVFFGVAFAQDLSPKKSLDVARFDCELNIEDVEWVMKCQSQNFMIDSTSQFFSVELHGIFNPVSPVAFQELLRSTSFKDSKLILCDSLWKDVLKTHSYILSEHCQNYTKLLRKLVKGLNKTSLSSIEISRTLNIEYILNILHGSTLLRRIVLSDNSLPSIPPLPVYRNNSVITVILKRNGIKNIADNFFSEFPSLEFLDLSHNLLKYVHKGMFGGLACVSKLDISFNLIQDISNDAFSNLLSLKSIVLRNNHLKHVREDFFRFMNLLVDIDISNNKVESLPSTIFHNLINLKNISCSNCSLFSFDRGLFVNLSSISKIDFSFNNIESIHEDSFKEMDFLSVLDLGYNKISNFSKNHFKNKKYLVHLNLTHNKIQSLENELFIGAPNIAFLDMSKNKIKTLTDDHIRGFYDIEQLNLRHNSMESIKLGLTTNEVFVRNLDISNNAITKIDVVWKRLTYMETFIANYNQLTSLDLPPCIPNVKKTLTLSFKYNNISNVHTEALILDEGKVKINQNLAMSCYYNAGPKNSVDLTHNPLFCDCKLYPFYKYLKEKSRYNIEKFLDEGNLTCAGPQHVSNLSLVSLSSDMFSCPLTGECAESCFCGYRGKDKLTFVNCSSSNFTEVPQDQIPNGIVALYFNNNQLTSMVSLNSTVWRNLSEIHLDHNLLENLDDWDYPVSLRYLSVRGNKLKTLPSSLKQFMKNQPSFQLFLGHNDKNCDCDRQELQTFLGEIKEFVQDKDDILCVVTSNGTSTFLPLLSVPDNILCPLDSGPLNYNQKTLVISLSVLFIFLLSLLLVYYKQRQLILSFLYIHCDDLYRLFFSEEEHDENHVFDAFVAYSSSDRDIVMKLMEELETNPPFFQLCIHERNWLPGRFITENIINSVHTSKRTIIILSSAFIASPWFNLELRAAVFKMSKDKINRVIVVLTEKSISFDNIDSELRHVISKRTYLVWGERWFWEKLRYAMPRKKRVKHPSGNIRTKSISEIPLMPEET